MCSESDPLFPSRCEQYPEHFESLSPCQWVCPVTGPGWQKYLEFLSSGRLVVFVYSSGIGDGMAGTVSGEIFGHHRWRSSVSQVQAVTC
jgi:hypothetical protein